MTSDSADGKAPPSHPGANGVSEPEQPTDELEAPDGREVSAEERATTQRPGPTIPTTEDLPPAEQEGPPISEDTIFTGPLLREIREARRITLKEISEKTRISVASLSALEDERYDALPNARVYVRGFVRCLATEIGLDRDHVSRTYVPRWEAWFYDTGSSR